MLVFFGVKFTRRMDDAWLSSKSTSKTLESLEQLLSTLKSTSNTLDSPLEFVLDRLMHKCTIDRDYKYLPQVLARARTALARPAAWIYARPRPLCHALRSARNVHLTTPFFATSVGYCVSSTLEALIIDQTFSK